jgi:hypothetical protein
MAVPFLVLACAFFLIPSPPRPKPSSYLQGWTASVPASTALPWSPWPPTSLAARDISILLGIFTTALATAGILGPLLSDILVQSFGFHFAFYAFAVLASAGAAVSSPSFPKPAPPAATSNGL